VLVAGTGLGHLSAGILLCITIIGIPLGLANFKLIPISLLPLGVRIVPSDELYPGYRALPTRGTRAQERSGRSNLGPWRRPRAGSRYT